jgi:hypothetical protein
MENFNVKIMIDFDSDSVPNFRKLVAANMIETRDNHKDNVEEIMNDELQA